MRIYVETERVYNVEPRMTGVYAWMSVALGITAGVAYYVSQSPAIVHALMTNVWLFAGIVLVQCALIFSLSSMIRQMSGATAFTGLIAYAILNGVMLSVIFMVYTPASIFGAFMATAGMFIVMALYGYITESDLSSWGNLLLMALIGIIAASLINMFFKNEQVDFVIACVGVVVFTLLVAYDTQKIKMLLAHVPDEYHAQVSVVGALMLYLDFINLLLNLLRIMGNRREK